MTLTFVHLSDIHLGVGRSGAHNLDADLHRGIQEDLANLVSEIGPVDSVLVTGDVAAKGDPTEFARSEDWLRGVCEFVGAQGPDSLLAVPGNHDIVRVLCDDEPVSSFHQALRGCPTSAIDAHLARWLDEKPETAALVLESHANYNRFAANIGCELSGGQPFWDREFKLGEGATLVLRGLTSTLVSDKHDDDGKNRLVLGRHQMQLPRTDGAVCMTMCHHPPDWFRDRDLIEEVLQPRARIQLFGHKHRQRVDQLNHCVRLSAGAVAPERDPSWDPRYNVLRVAVDDSPPSVLIVEVYPRVFDSKSQRFAADLDRFTSSATRRFELPFAPFTKPKPAPAKPPDQLATQAEQVLQMTTTGDPVPHKRRLVYAFFRLPHHKQVRVLKLFGVSMAPAAEVTAESVQRALNAAETQSRLAVLWSAIAPSAGEPGPNPFEGE